MAQHFLPEAPDIPILLRRSPRARQITLRISQLDGRVTLSTPRHISDAEALDFARSKIDWLRSHLAKRFTNVIVTENAQLPIEGAMRTVARGSSKSPSLSDDALILPKRGSAARQSQAFLKNLARERLTAASLHYAQKLGRDFTRITLRDTRSRWGSCSSQGALMYSWRLVMAPQVVLRYVAAHEVAHLEEMNHSQAFWDVVETLYGDWRPQRDWLHNYGSQLHAYRFDDAKPAAEYPPA